MTNFDWSTELVPAMNKAKDHLENGDVFSAFDILGSGMTKIYASACAQGQVGSANATVKDHELFSIALEDPYSNRAYKKPRGYAGDAVMMDYVYSGIAPNGTTALGKTVFTGTTRGSMGLSVLFRRQLLTAYINEIASTLNGFNILSVASGHCREIDGSLLANSAFSNAGKLLAFDQDAESCKTVEREYAQYPIDVVCDGVHRLLTNGNSSFGKFDLIYSAGLFDYLTDSVAAKLIDVLAAMLKPGGKLLVGNFSPSARGRGYMELFLDWRLIYRDAADLLRLFGAERAASTSSFLDPHSNVVYAEWQLKT